jgi:hypothetical protein
MDELDLFRDFNSRASGPSGEAQRRALAGLTRAIEGERGRSGTRPLRRPRRRLAGFAVAFLALAGAGVTALALDAPWQSSPGFLEQAQAALAPPDGLILHAKWQITRTSREYGCTVTSGPNEVWVDPTSQRWRIIAHEWPSQDRSDGRAKACGEGMTMEVGGDTTGSFAFVPPDTLEPFAAFAPGHPGSWDAVDHLRQALADGRAHMDGRTELAGRTVERIRIECHVEPEVACPGRPADYFYVDPETFFPVQFELPNSLHYSTPSGLLDFDVVGRYLTYEYLPRTEANLALTDIQAQHPGATER